MTNIDNNSLYAVLRDVKNGALTVEDAALKIQTINKSDMKDDTPNPTEEQLELMPEPSGITLEAPADTIVEDTKRTKKATDTDNLKGVSKKAAPKD